ncbi:MAG: hypothetical protein KDB23_23320 [Planctomycetales bacterium]|nr:hypothetical protein [Planctomycetales bacterium]
MRWFLYWDEQNRLWTYNSDMGPFGVWIHDGSSDFQFHEINSGDPLLESMPKEVLDNLPHAMLRHLELSAE